MLNDSAAECTIELLVVSLWAAMLGCGLERGAPNSTALRLSQAGDPREAIKAPIETQDFVNTVELHHRRVHSVSRRRDFPAHHDFPGSFRLHRLTPRGRGCAGICGRSRRGWYWDRRR